MSSILQCVKLKIIIQHPIGGLCQNLEISDTAWSLAFTWPSQQRNSSTWYKCLLMAWVELMASERWTATQLPARKLSALPPWEHTDRASFLPWHQHRLLTCGWAAAHVWGRTGCANPPDLQLVTASNMLRRGPFTGSFIHYTWTRWYLLNHPQLAFTRSASFT